VSSTEKEYTENKIRKQLENFSPSAGKHDAVHIITPKPDRVATGLKALPVLG
jgi:hypothetical protein